MLVLACWACCGCKLKSRVAPGTSFWTRSSFTSFDAWQLSMHLVHLLSLASSSACIYLYLPHSICLPACLLTWSCAFHNRMTEKEGKDGMMKAAVRWAAPSLTKGPYQHTSPILQRHVPQFVYVLWCGRASQPAAAARVLLFCAHRCAMRPASSWKFPWQLILCLTCTSHVPQAVPDGPRLHQRHLPQLRAAGA